MALQKVIITDNVIQECYAHAFLTDREEVMGVLLGEMINVGEANDGKSMKIARIWASKVIQRKDKRSDRVEIAPEHLYVATEHAEYVTSRVGRHTRVLGWYHSHPRITPYPSAVDLNCQSGFQLMEKGWVGLIFSVFHADSTLSNSATVHAFQTGVGGTHEKIAISVVPSSAMFEEGLGTCRECPSLLDTFSTEVNDYREAKRALCNHAPQAKHLVDTVAEAQLYALQRLLGDNTLHFLENSYLPELRRRVAAMHAALDAR